MSTREPATEVGQGGQRRHGFAVSAAFGILLITMLLLAGCSVGVGLDTKVNTDGSGTVSVRLAADKDLQEALSGAAASSGLGSLTEGLGDLDGLLGGLLDELRGLDGLLDELGGLGELLDGLGSLGDLGESGDLETPENPTEMIPGSVDELFNMIVGELTGDWQVQRGADSDGTQWMNITHPFADPEELEELLQSSALASIINVDTFTLTQDDGFFGTKTQFAATADIDSALSRFGDTAYGIPMDLVTDVIVIENRLTLPGSIRDNNADDVQGNTLIWNIGSQSSEQMYAESISYNYGAIIGVIVAGGIVIGALIVLLVLLLMRRKRPSEPQTAQPGQYPYGPAPTIAGANQANSLPSPVEEDRAFALPAGTQAAQLAAPPEAQRPQLMQAARLALPPVSPPVQTGGSTSTDLGQGPAT